MSSAFFCAFSSRPFSMAFFFIASSVFASNFTLSLTEMLPAFRLILSYLKPYHKTQSDMPPLWQGIMFRKSRNWWTAVCMRRRERIKADKWSKPDMSLMICAEKPGKGIGIHKIPCNRPAALLLRLSVVGEDAEAMTLVGWTAAGLPGTTVCSKEGKSRVLLPWFTAHQPESRLVRNFLENVQKIAIKYLQFFDAYDIMSRSKMDSRNMQSHRRIWHAWR